MKKLKISYCDWWDNGKDFIFTKILEQKYNLEFSSPYSSDVVFCGPFGSIKDSINSLKIYYTGENTRNPNNVFKLNYNIDSDIRLPIYYVMSNEYTFISNRKSPLLLENRIISDRNNFCGFLVSNPSNNIRNKMLSDLSKYKKVDSGGRVFNNIGYLVSDTIKWTSNYKFFISFENSKYDYYVTEKLINAYHAGCIPIYWGSDKISEELNENCFINANKHTSEEIIEMIKEIESDDNLYKKFLKEPLLKDNIYDEKWTSDGILDIFEKIINK